MKTPEDFVGFWINLASRCIVRNVDAELRPMGFALSQLPVLRALAEGGPCSQTELARVARVEQQTMAELLTRMERDGLVGRTPNPDDRRGRLISLSKTARARFAKARATLAAGERRAMTGFSAEEKAVFVDLLKRVVANTDK